MEESREKNAQSAQRASRIGLMRSWLGVSTPGSGTHAREQVDQKLEASGRKSEDVQRVKDFFDHLNEIAKEGSLPFPAHRFLMSGLIVMDLIVLQAFVSLGRLDLPATLALIALSIAIPTAAGSLFLGFVRSEEHTSELQSHLN